MIFISHNYNLNLKSSRNIKIKNVKSDDKMARKTFTGSYCLLVILLCIGIIPGIIYYAIARREIGGSSKQVIKQNIVIQQPRPEQQKLIQYCLQCGAVVKSNFCENCGAKMN